MIRCEEWRVAKVLEGLRTAALSAGASAMTTSRAADSAISGRGTGVAIVASREGVGVPCGRGEWSCSWVMLDEFVLRDGGYLRWLELGRGWRSLVGLGTVACPQLCLVVIVAMDC